MLANSDPSLTSIVRHSASLVLNMPAARFIVGGCLELLENTSRFPHYCRRVRSIRENGSLGVTYPTLDRFHHVSWRLLRHLLAFLSGVGH
jgi:hypothetical protein